jgi:urease accessory protein UreF
MLDSHKLSPADEARAIKVGTELENMTKQPGWKHIEAFMEKNKMGTHAIMEKEIQVVKSFTIASLFGAFAKYLLLSAENRAYNKIKTYANVSIENGKRLASARAKRSGGE